LVLLLSIDWSQYDAVSFDVGETLLRPFPSFPVSFRRICWRNGVRLTRDQADQIDAATTARLVEYQQRGLTFSTTTESSEDFWVGLYRGTLEKLGVDGLAADALPGILYGEFTQARAYRLFADSRPTLQRAKRRGLKVGVLSNWEAWLARMLADIGIASKLDFVTISGVCGHEKPSPAIFHEALECAGVVAERMVHVGDSLHHDVAGAKAVGITPVLIDRHGRHPDADCLRIRSLAELGL
jgi:putative hydrolase of the HAD superfamily